MRPAPPPAAGSRSRLSAACLCLLLAAPVGTLAQSDSGEALQLGPLVVTASGFEQDVKEAPASISVITRQELEEKRVSSVAEALTDVEGVDVGAPVGKTGGMNISIRGMPSEYTLILIDGRRQNVAGNVTPNGFGETQTSFMPPVSAIERIEVIRGPMSTLYGSDAMGGVINIITRKVAREWGGELTLEGTVHEDSDYGNSQAVSLYTSGPLVQDRLGAQLRGRFFNRDASDLQYIQDDGSAADVSKRGPSPVEGDIYDIGGRLTFTPNQANELWLDAEHSRQAYDNSEGQLGTLWNPGDTGNRGGYAEELRFERTQHAVGHTARLRFGELQSSLMHNLTETMGREIPPGLPNAGAPRTLETKNTVFDTKLTMPVGDAHVVTLGGQWWNATLIDAIADEDELEQATWALFTEDEWLLHDDLALTLGVRYDDHDAFGSNFSPRAYLVWTATDNWTLKGGISRGYKTPRVEQLGTGIVGITGQGVNPQIGNPYLEPETSTSVEVGTIYDNRRGFSAGMTLFYNDFTDKIATVDCRWQGVPGRPDCTGFDPEDANTFINIDDAVTQGTEVFTRIQLSQSWLLTANYTYTDSEQKSGDHKGAPLTDTPEHMVNARLCWQATERFSAWLSGEYNSERYRSDDTARAVLSNYRVFTLFHAGAGYRVTESVTLNAAIYNLADKNFIDYRWYGINSRGEDLYGNRYANAEPGRRLWLSANVAF